MKIDKQTFDLDEELSISINFEDNDGLVFIPKNVSVEIKIINYFVFRQFTGNHRLVDGKVWSCK